MTRGHWSDCSVNNAPAYEPGPCDCGGLDLAAYDRYVRITALIPTPRGLALFIKDGVLPCAVETEQSPGTGITAPGPSANLPCPHEGGAVFGSPHGVDFDNAAITSVSDVEPLTGLKRLTSNVPPHKPLPESPSN